jgi:hemerythrin-like metal-binding protein
MTQFWNPNLEMGNAQLDEQHLMMYQILDTLLTAISEQKGRAALAGALGTLSAYVISHFELEENLMIQSGYRNLEAHRESHDALQKQVDNLLDQFHDGGLNKVDLICFMQDWLGNHIQKHDKPLVDFLGAAKRAAR